MKNNIISLALFTGLAQLLTSLSLSRPADEHTTIISFLPRAVYTQVLRQSLLLQLFDLSLWLKLFLTNYTSSLLPLLGFSIWLKCIAIWRLAGRVHIQLLQKFVFRKKFREAGFSAADVLTISENSIAHDVETFLLPFEHFLMLKNRWDICKIKNIDYTCQFGTSLTSHNSNETFPQQLLAMLSISKSSQTLSVYYSAKNRSLLEHEKNIKCLLFIHGGGWRVGSSEIMYRDIVDVIHSLDGYVVVAIDYRLAPEVSVHSMVEDVNLAISWTKNNLCSVLNTSEKSVEIVISGNSAGGHLALVATLQPNHFNLKGCIDIYGVKDFLDSYNFKSSYDGGAYKKWVEKEIFGKSVSNNLKEAKSFDPFSLIKAVSADNSTAATIPPLFIVREYFLSCFKFLFRW